jgi:hypothetical protein
MAVERLIRKLERREARAARGEEDSAVEGYNARSLVWKRSTATSVAILGKPPLRWRAIESCVERLIQQLEKAEAKSERARGKRGADDAGAAGAKRARKAPAALAYVSDTRGPRGRGRTLALTLTLTLTFTSSPFSPFTLHPSPSPSPFTLTGTLTLTR